MSAASRLGVAWRVLRSEGAAAVRDRACDRLAEAARRRAYTPFPSDWRPEAWTLTPIPSPTRTHTLPGEGRHHPKQESAAPWEEVPPLPGDRECGRERGPGGEGSAIPVLLVTATPPVPWLGGVQTQLRSRLEDEVRGRSIALLFHDGGAWRLEVRSGADRFFLHLPGLRPSPEALEDSAFAAAVRRAAERVGARAVHAEGLAGLPPASLLRLAREGMTVLLTLHDFAALHPSPHRVASPLDAVFPRGRREIAAELLTAARAVVFPSEFLRRAHLDLFPGLPEDRTHILEPPLASTVALPRRPAASGGRLRHVALVGSVQPHKGAGVFAEVVRRMKGAGLRWSSYGGGDAPLLRDLRRLGVRVRGYYRSGSLPGLLRRDEVDVVLLLSVIPESYSLTLGECVVAGVPVIAFGSGALAERVPRLGAGRVVDPGLGAEGIVEALNEGGSLPAIPEDAVHLLSDPVSAAAGHLALYRELQLL